jgi:hypothetical protein
LGSRDAVVLRRGLVELAPAARLETDVERFEAGDESAYGGELLPDDRYEEWAVGPRERLRERRRELLRATGRWTDVLQEDPADEEAHRELMRAAASAGDRPAAARQFRSLRDELARLGLQPSAATIALYAEIARGPAVHDVLRLDDAVEGRDRELAVVRDAMRAAAGGRGNALLLLGDPGMGKTRIAEVVLADGERRGWHTLRGVAHDEEGPVAYGPVVEALEPLLLARPDLVAGLADRTQEVLGLLSPAMPRGADDTEARAAERHELLAGLGQLLAAAARERGVVVVLEDLHGADQATLHVVHYLARVARRERMLLVVSARPGEASPGFVRLRASLRERRAAVDVVLALLPASATRRIAGRAAQRSLPEQTAGAIEAAAAGNPFFAQELAAAVDPTGRVRVPEQLQICSTPGLPGCRPRPRRSFPCSPSCRTGSAPRNSPRWRESKGVSRPLRSTPACAPGSSSAPSMACAFGIRCCATPLAGGSPPSGSPAPTPTPPWRWPRVARRRSGSRTTGSRRAGAARPCRCWRRRPAVRPRSARTRTASAGSSRRSSTQTRATAPSCSPCSAICASPPAIAARRRPSTRR